MGWMCFHSCSILDSSANSLADQAGQDLEMSTSFCVSIFSALSEKSNVSFPCLNALQRPSSVPC